MLKKSEVIISDPLNFEKKKESFLNEGSQKIHVVSDFDRTLTKAFVNNKKIPSVISILRDKNYFTEDYSIKAKKVFEEYHPIEINPKISEKEKKEKMHEWWSRHFELLINSKLNKKSLEKIIDEEVIQFREGAFNFLETLYKKNIPLIIFSSSGIGDIIKMLLEKNKRLYNNIYIITNEYVWDKKGYAISLKNPIIHLLNKSEVSIKEKSFYPKIENRTNVLLLGDSLGDLEMIKGFNYQHLISIGFLNYNIDENINYYKNNFDVVVTNDGDFKWINKFVEEIK